jgi:hypothetical protein
MATPLILPGYATSAKSAHPTTSTYGFGCASASDTFASATQTAKESAQRLIFELCIVSTLRSENSMLAP